MLPSKVHLLSLGANKKQYVSAKVSSGRVSGGGGSGEKVVLGFFNREHADIVKRTIDVGRDVEVVSQMVEDISMEVNIGLKKFGVSQEVGDDLMIDAASTLYVPICRTGMDAHAANIEITTEDTGEFLMWPLQKYVGIVMPTGDEFREDYIKDYIVFDSQVVFPCFDVEKFRRGLID